MREMRTETVVAVGEMKMRKEEDEEQAYCCKMSWDRTAVDLLYHHRHEMPEKTSVH